MHTDPSSQEPGDTHMTLFFSQTVSSPLNKKLFGKKITINKNLAQNEFVTLLILVY